MFRPTSLLGVFVFFSFLLLGEFSLYAQRGSVNNPIRIPIYKSERDSVRVNEIHSQIALLRETAPASSKKLDSLFHLYEETHKKGIIGYRNDYLPAQDHIGLDSLMKMTDFTSVTKVSIHNYAAAELPGIIFRCKNLTSLEMINTGITELPARLDSLPNLQSVKICNPAVSGKIKLNKNAWVKVLIIRSDNPGCLPRRYRSFSALETLDLSRNSLRRFPNGARRNTQLRELNLQHNHLTLNHKLRKHPFVEILALQYNEIQRVPKSIRSFRNVKKLNFNYNQITSAHRAIRFLNKLENLSFYHNELSAIPDGVYETTTLREIDLFHNKIETIEPRIVQWQNLRTLYLSHNRISSLPDDIGALTSLEGLYVWENHLEALPESLGDLTSLRYLWLNNNNLRQLPHSLLSLKKIEELDVSHNFLTSISESVFDFRKLKILSLIDNPWNEKTLAIIHRRVSELRNRNVFVHIPDK